MSVKRREGVYNPNRRILPIGSRPLAELKALAKRVGYGGNLEHKLRPGDYGLGTPPNPRPRKMMCDANGPFDKTQAQELLAAGARKGMISRQERGDLPQNIWSVSEAGVAYEAQLENREQAMYHGYPMAENDDFRTLVLQEWAKR